jgi:hypothetical protein
MVVGAQSYSNGQSKERHAYSFHGSATGLVATAWNQEVDVVDEGALLARRRQDHSSLQQLAPLTS